ncbi:class I SAM-dependent DNA methyltransferase [Streptomyces sp. NPDC048172]|uniref:class I SAM-dependent DNA methyltransferase n=1 Tax=Streptomyces sp. NPDC048172 TaxID=3365505 RepID=UPI003723729B
MNTFDTEDFWTDFYDILFPESRFTQAAALVADSPLLDFPPGTRILDMCCGAGVFTAPLAARGHDTTGVDRSPAMLKKAGEHCRAAGVAPRLVEADAREVREPGAYDVVLNLFTSFGYFEDPADNAAVLDATLAALRPGGTLLLDLAGKELLARRAHGTKAVRHGEDTVFQTDTVLEGWERLRSDWVLVRGERAYRARLEWFMYTAAELRRMLRDAGFSEVETFGGFDARPYDGDAERLIVRARR